MILFEYEVWQHYEDQAPEPFGCQCFTCVPREGDIIELYWLDGRSAGLYRVTDVDEDRFRIDVVSHKQEESHGPR